MFIVVITSLVGAFRTKVTKHRTDHRDKAAKVALEQAFGRRTVALDRADLATAARQGTVEGYGRVKVEVESEKQYKTRKGPPWSPI